MKRSEEIPHWLLWVWAHGFQIFCVFLVVVTAGIVVFGMYANRRLMDIEKRLAYEPPRQYRAPDLDQFAAEDGAWDRRLFEQRLYVPVYSHVYYGHGRPYSLEATLSVRNADPQKPIYIASVDYFDTSGKLVEEYVDRVIKLDPLQTIEFLVEARDSQGGSGANFIVRWFAVDSVVEPLVEAVMVGVTGTQGIAFSRSSRVIEEHGQPVVVE